MKKRILFIINPLSGVGRHKTIEKLIEKKLNKNIFDYKIAFTHYSKHATELSKKAVEEGYEIIAVAGGDGSVNEAGRSLVGTDSSLAILPCGSGNGTARCLGLPLNLEKAIRVINYGKSKIIDTFFVNEDVCINTAGVGYAAHIAHEFAKLKKRGFGNYLKLAVRDSRRFKTFFCEAEIKSPAPSLPIREGENNTNPLPTSREGFRRGLFFIIDIANGNQWGNNAIIAPQAKNDDGVLDICLVKKFPFVKFPFLAMRLFTNSIHRSKYVEIVRTKEATIHLCSDENRAHIDGEPVVVGNELRIKINPASLKVLVPNVDIN